MHYVKLSKMIAHSIPSCDMLSQVKNGKCDTGKPGFFDFEGQRKW